MVITAKRAQMVIGFVALFSAAIGYGGRSLQDRRFNKPSTYVDPSWVEAARGCWKGFRTFRDSEIASKLADPNIFRTTFEAHSTESDEAVLKTIQKKHIWAMPIRENASAPHLPKGYTLEPPSQSNDIFSKAAAKPLDAVQIDPKTGERVQAGEWDVFCTVQDGVPTSWQTSK